MKYSLFVLDIEMLAICCKLCSQISLIQYVLVKVGEIHNASNDNFF